MLEKDVEKGDRKRLIFYGGMDETSWSLTESKVREAQGELSVA